MLDQKKALLQLGLGTLNGYKAKNPYRFNGHTQLLRGTPSSQCHMQKGRGRATAFDREGILEPIQF